MCVSHLVEIYKILQIELFLRILTRGTWLYTVFTNPKNIVFLVCVGDFNLNSGAISQPNETKYYCSWKNEVEHPNSTLAINIVMDVTNHSNSYLKCKDPHSHIYVTTENLEENLMELCRSYIQPVTIRSPFATTHILVSVAV